MSSAQASNSATTEQEYVIRVPKNNSKKYHVMRFNGIPVVDFLKWNQVKMERENNMKEFRGLDDEIPKYGAGSEFGRDQREEARRKKFGIVTKKYRPEDQPWILKVGGKTGKKFKGIREGGVGENAAYYIFTHAPDGAIEAFPLGEWYNFQPIQRYKALSAEEAEQEFGRRNKVMNYFSLMLRKRLRNDEDGEMEELEDGRRGGGGKAGKGELKISEMDDWVDSDGGEDNSDEEDADKEKDEDVKEKKGKGKGKANAKEKAKKKRNSDDEAFEESDDGDEEGREVDYISDSSDSEIDLDENVKDSMKGVAEEDALRKLLTSDEEDDEEREEGENEDGDEEKADGDKGDDGDGDGKKGGADSDGDDDKKGASSSKKKKAKPKKDLKKKDPSSILNDSSSNDSSDSSDSETKKKGSKGKETNSGNSSRAATPTKAADGPLSSASSSSSTTGGDSNKRKADSDGLSGGSAKKPRMDGISSAYSDSGITEEAVRRYLMRKPMTTTELLQKFKSKKTGLSSEQLVTVMTQILKRINPIKQFIKGKMYLSIKA